MTLSLTDTAEADLAEIWAYLTMEAGEQVAANMLTSLKKTLDVLQKSPFIGTMRETLGVELTVMFYNAYAIYYKISGSELVIVRVLHGARDSAAISDQGGFLQ